ncbi:MAG: hypothetical protein SW833_00380 [Cyanobacteriota bacterium]|nr:hypothetical protein [Cyanobacteriota bacterium]
MSQSESADYVLGSQPTFWRSSDGQDYWGVTTIQRWGFTPPISFGGGGFVPSQRLQANLARRTISGEAEPGTLVQLTEGFSDFAIAEILVDSSGVYRFDNIPVQRGSYRVFLYPNGQLTGEPEIQNATFSTIPGQLPVGASALIVSGGSRRELARTSNFSGEFAELQGGIAYRRGVTEELTLGMGLIYDENGRGLGEFFYQPSNFPLEVSVSALTPGSDRDWDIDAALNFYPTSNLRFNLNSDRLSQRFTIDWQLFNGFALTSRGNNRDRSLETGFRFFKSSRDFSIFANATIDLNRNLRWSLNSRWGNLRLLYQGNEIATTSELSYGLSGRNSLLAGHSLFLGYDTRNLDNLNSNLLSLGWRYRSFSRAADGEYFWTFNLGYALGFQGSGMFASVSTTVVPGIDLRLRYQQVSLTTNSPTFRIELVPSVNLQSGRINPGDRRFDDFRN